MEQTVLSPGVRAGWRENDVEEIRETAEWPVHSSMVSNEGELKLSKRWKFGDGNTLLKMTTRQQFRSAKSAKW
jgi:hypothetical protein